MKKEIINKVAAVALVAVMSLTALAPVTTYAAENDCPHNEMHTVDIKTPTCTEDGLWNVVCDLCGKVLEENVKAPAYGHAFTNATFKNGIVDTRTCETCGETIKFIPEKSVNGCTHDEEETYNCDYEGCTTNGYTGDTVCTQCGKVLEMGKVIPAYGHDWEEAKYIKPTCTTDGTKVYICANCDEKKEEVIKATGHKWDEGKITLAPSTTKEGIKEYTCQSCGEKKKETLAKLPTGDNSADDSKNHSKDNTALAKNNTKPVVAKKGTKFKVNGNTYVVTKEGADVRFSKAKYNIKSLVIPNTIKANDVIYKVTSIGTKAVKNNKKIKKVTIGFNVKTIKAKAFYNCPKLKKVTVKNSKLKKKAIKKGISKVNKKLVIKR